MKNGGQVNNKLEFKKSDSEFAGFLAKALTYACLHDTSLKPLHEKIVPQSLTGDYSDVKVVTPAGEFGWNEVQRISASEMAQLTQAIADRLYTFLCRAEDGKFLVALERLAKPTIGHWREPEFLPEFVTAADQ